MAGGGLWGWGAATETWGTKGPCAPSWNPALVWFQLRQKSLLLVHKAATEA